MDIDYSLYLVTDQSLLKGVDLFTAVEQALQGGVTMLQLREKEASTREFYELALEMLKLAHSYHVPLIINDRLDVALASGADGLHIGQDDLPVELARRLLGPRKILGYSVANVEQAREGEHCRADYLGAGPVFPTGSKADAGEVIGVKALQQIKESVTIPVVGIGGIGPANLAQVRAAGIDGIAVISAIMGSEDLREAASGLVKTWRNQ